MSTSPSNGLSEAEVLDMIHRDRGDSDGLGWVGHADPKRPDEEAMAAEESAPLDVDGERRATLWKIFDHVLADWHRRPDAADVGRRVLAMAKFCGHPSVERWSLGELAKACGETKAATSARVKRVCNEPIERAGGIAQARWQQGVDQRAKSAEVQKGNRNRLGLGREAEKISPVANARRDVRTKNQSGEVGVTRPDVNGPGPKLAPAGEPNNQKPKKTT
jgi:hypothetical protein